jgi:ABC-type glycerol-3-phosphate transport system substrate-binding protein
VTGGEPTDILLLDGQFVMAYKRDDLIYPAEDYVDFVDRYAKGVLDTISHDGKAWAVPWESVVCMFWLNKNVFQEYNLPRPNTWNDVKTIRDKLEGTGIAPIVYPAAQVWWMPMLLFVTLADFTDNDPIGFTMKTMRGEVGYNHPNYVNAYTRIESFAKGGYLIKGATGIDFDGAIQLFVQGKAAMFYMGNWALPTIKSAVSDPSIITTNWVPHDPGMIPQPAGGPGFCTTISKQTKNLDGAAKFVEYIARDDSAYLVATKRGSPTGNKAADERAGNDLNDPIWVSFVPYYENVVVFFDWLWEPEITKEFQVQIQALLGGQVTPQEVGDLVQKRFEELRDEGRAYFWK